MKFLTGLLSFVLLFAGAGSGVAAVRIANDHGGMIGPYIDKYEGLRRSGQVVVIDGQCASACTIVLGKIPHDKICVTSNAALAFHAAFDFGSGGQEITNRAATRALYSMYPLQVQRWISRQGGLTPHLIVLRGAELAKMYRPCDLNAWASSTIEPRVAAARRARIGAMAASEGKAEEGQRW